MDKNFNSSSERKLNCKDVGKCFKLLESILDGETDIESREILNEKLEKCQPCFQHFHLEKAIREVLKNKCTKCIVPVELADSIRQKIQAIK